MSKHLYPTVIKSPKDIEGSYDFKVSLKDTIPYRCFFEKIGDKVYRFSKLGDKDWRADLMPFKDMPYVILRGLCGLSR